ncbi:DUF3082 domain-containing protein [Roseofilum reptotaenium CS-1145]|uniref:DUF3082 domain-containing protein n=1 Tax=Roseofilum reptotaenium AO1-A TaxID=1925591 RepID=A0A1L9QX49_9CYAN|nr:DUF3082 domain-containing protein [Roseofilum reptotaenium]MDB9519268.1 DUF3082 domain-containing protein [Roseofilum reptotaenium CS-1145]OJJ27233.1 hypothetical protein BI308_01735 [Roseofilum reptotaenium AO1-A]
MINHNESISEQTSKPAISANVTPVRCLTGALMSGAITSFLYFLSMSIIETFANKPLATKNAIALNIGAAVRTLVMGMGLLATGVFALTTVGLLALAIQLSVRKSTVN